MTKKAQVQMSSATDAVDKTHESKANIVVDKVQQSSESHAVAKAH